MYRKKTTTSEKKTSKPLSQKKKAIFDANVAITKRWLEILNVDHEAAKRISDNVATEGARRERSQLVIDASVVETLLSEMVDKIVEIEPRSAKNPIPRTSLRTSKEQTWYGRAMLIAFHLHASFGNNERSVFESVFKDIVPAVTMISWLRKDLVHKWLPIVRIANRSAIMQIVPKQKRFLFEIGDDDETIPRSVIQKYDNLGAQVAKSQKKVQLVFGATSSLVSSSQKKIALAQTSHHTMQYVKLTTRRLPCVKKTLEDHPSIKSKKNL